MLAILERAQQQAGAGRPLGDQGAHNSGSSAPIEPFHEAVIGGPVDLIERQTTLGGGKRRDLPVADVGGKEDSGVAIIAQPIDVLGAQDGDAAIVAIDLDLAEMGVFGGDPAQVIPHAANDGLDLARRFFGKCAAEVGDGAPRDAKVRSDGARQPAAERRRRVERQNRENAVGPRGGRRLNGVQKGAAQRGGESKCVEHHRDKMGSRIASRAVSSSHSRVTVKTRTASIAAGGRRWASLAVVTSWASAARASSLRRTKSAAR